MSRFADPNAIARFVIGDCECPGKPHDEDFMDLRSELGAQDMADIAAKGTNMGILEVICVGWNLLDNDGKPAPVDADHIGRLFIDSMERLDGWLNEHVRALTLPNASGAPSVNGSRASASAIRTTRKRR